MGIKVKTTNMAEDLDPIEVDEAEFRDLALLGLIKAGVGDVDEKGQLTKKAAKEAPGLVQQFPTGPVPVPPAA